MGHGKPSQLGTLGAIYIFRAGLRLEKQSGDLFKGPAAWVCRAHITMAPRFERNPKTRSFTISVLLLSMHTEWIKRHTSVAIQTYAPH